MLQSHLTIRQIKFDSEDYKKELDLRDRVLKKPIGLNILDEELGSEINDHHIGAFLGSDLIGILLLTGINSDEVQMRQVAVEEEFRGKDIGSRLVAYSEKLAKDLGYKRMVLNSRMTAVPFYEKLGYRKTGSEFIEVNIPHFKMLKFI